MIYKVTHRLFFSSKDEAQDFYHDGQMALPKAVNVKPGLRDQENSVIRLERCFHDQDPTTECVLMEQETTPI